MNQIVEKLLDETVSREKVSTLRATVESQIPKLLDSVHFDSRKVALDRAVTVVHMALAQLQAMGVSLEGKDPGHGVGHMLRDYVNALRLFSSLDTKYPKDIFVGFVAGCLHDIGCTQMYRYDESSRVVRHAEVGALLLRDILEQGSFGLSEAEILLVQYAVAAHTHYLKAMTVKTEDGSEKTIQPYVDEINHVPVYGFWLPRWVDRLDGNGAMLVARHFLTLHQEHKDFDGKDFVTMDFANQMVPRFKEDCGHNTMLNHIRMYANSQTNDSPYGQHDFGTMVEMRDVYTLALQRIIEAVAEGSLALDIEKTLDLWTNFLGDVVEPTLLGKTAAQSLRLQFGLLPVEHQQAWARGFAQAMFEYENWSMHYMSPFLRKEIDPKWLSLSGISENVADSIEWTRPQ